MMNDLFKMKRTLEESGFVEGEGFTVEENNTGFLLVIYKKVVVGYHMEDDVCFNFEYDKFGNLIEVW